METDGDSMATNGFSIRYERGNLMYHGYDLLDGFQALFGDGRVVFPKRSLPLGAAVVDVLNMSEEELDRLDAAALSLRFDVLAYLSGEYDATQAGLTNEALISFFSLLSEYPVYRELEQKRRPSISFLRSHAEIRERMRTPGTDEYAVTQAWLERLRTLVPSLREFREKAEKMLEHGFADVTERTASGYAKRLSAYYAHAEIQARYLSDALDQADPDDVDYLRQREDYQRDFAREFFPALFPIEVAFRTIPHPEKAGAFLLAEEVFFRELSTFLSLDLMRGFASGHLPRRCEHCGRWFLLVNGYDTRYCENPAPEEPEKTCRQVGAHRKETRLNGTVEIREEYTRVTNRLKGQKFRKTLSTDDWNALMRQVQDLREEALTGKLTVAELRERYDGISLRRKKTVR